MKWFGRKSAGRDGSRPVLARGMGLAFVTDEGGAWPRSYEARARAGFIDNPVAQRAVRMVAEGAQGAPLYGEGDHGAALVALVTRGDMATGGAWQCVSTDRHRRTRDAGRALSAAAGTGDGDRR